MEIKLAKKIEKIEKTVIVVLSISLISLTFISVIFRRLFSPIVWSIELSRFLYIWIIFISIYSALRFKEHISIEFFLKRVEDKKNLFNKLETLKWVFTLIYFIILAIFSFQYTYIYMKRGVTTISLHFPYFFYPLAIVFGSILAIAWLIREKRNKNKIKEFIGRE